MDWPIDIVADLSPERFAEVFAANPRPVREALLSRYGAKTAVRTGTSPAAAAAERVRFVQRKMTADAAPQGRDLADELLRNWLMGKRALLAETLDEFKVKHVNGITDAPLDFFEKLPEERVRALCEKLVPAHGREAVGVYLRYLKVPGAKQALESLPAPA